MNRRLLFSKGIPQYIIERAQKYPEDPVCDVIYGDSMKVISASEILSDSFATAKGLLGIGIAKGDCIGIISSPRYECLMLDIAIWLVGGISVPIHETSSSIQIEYIKNDTGLKIVIDDKTINNIEKIIENGVRIPDVELINRTQSVQADDIATIMYTSGTSENPLGVELTHNNIMGTINGIISESTQSGLENLLNNSSKILEFLPLSHVLARTTSHIFLASRARICFCPRISELTRYLNVYKPTCTIAVPQLLELIYKNIYENSSGFIKCSCFKIASHIASSKTQKKSLNILEKMGYRIFNRILYSQIQKGLGGNIQYIIVGGSSLKKTTECFFRGIGIEIIQGYGLTETSGPITFQRPREKKKIGSVGTIIRENEICISEDNEVLVRGVSVTSRYFKGGLIEGWLHTGDIGHIDDDGYLYVDGRKKEIIVTSNGVKINPIPIENAILQHTIISQAAVVGNDRPYITMLITLDITALNNWRNLHGFQNISSADAVNDVIVNKEIKNIVKKINEKLSHAESIRKFIVVNNGFTIENDCLTLTNKLKRDNIIRFYSKEIDSMYK